MSSKWRAMGRTVAVGAGILLMAGSVGAETVLIEAVADATLIQDPDGALANGSGPVFFVGRNNQRENSVRRSVVRFDVASALPARARIEDVRLTLYMTPSNAAPRMLRLHRVLSAWGEGDSYATGGGGATSSPGDATWIHTLYDELRWRHAGGDFVPRMSAVRRVAGSGLYAWEGTRKMKADVLLWLWAPQRNFGWILIGDESSPQTAKSFASREAPDPSIRPVLEVRYRLPGRQAAAEPPCGWRGAMHQPARAVCPLVPHGR